jgi:type IV fimbrial biogenesis protein FimT
MNFRFRRQFGFTVVELMVALAVAGVLVGLALPAFNDFLAQRRLTSQVNDFLVALQFARSEAVRRGTNVSVQSIDASDTANEWGKGYCVVVGNPGNCPNDPTVTLRTFDSTGDNTLDAQNALDTLGTLTFDARGLLVGAGAGNVDLCDPTVDRGRQIEVSLIGRVSSQALDCNP